MSLSASDSMPVTTGRKPDRFFFFATALLLLLLLAAFAPTFFIKRFFDSPELPLYLHVHGALLTLWFVWLLAQSTLIALKRTDLHRRLGKFAAVFGFAIIPAGLMANLRMVPRGRAAGMNVEANIDLLSSIVWGNICNLVLFAGFLVTALYMRRRPDYHKRLMLLATFSIMGPVMARISFWPVFQSIGEITFIVFALLAMVGSLIAHDLFTARRLHVATLYGVSLYVLTLVGEQFLAGTEFARSFVLGL